MKKLTTSLLLTLVMALPLQSMASVSLFFCQPATVPHEHHHHEAADEVASSSEHSHHQVDTKVSSHQCSHCAQCCATPALPVSILVAFGHIQIEHVWTATLQQLHSDVEPRFLERPPRNPLL